MTDHREQQESATSCRGKGFEHHERPGIDEEARWPGAWRCPDCGDTGTFEASLRQLLELQPLLHQLQLARLDVNTAFLVPSDATPGRFGDCFGRPVYRVRGIDRPMITLGIGAFQAAVGQLLAKQVQP